MTMPKILLNDQELKGLITVNWAGSYDNVSRSLSFDYLIGSVSCRVGDKIAFYSDDVLKFVGQVYKANFKAKNDVMSVHCFDLLHNMVKSKAAGRYAGTLPQIASSICTLFGLKSNVSVGETTQEIITTGDFTYYDIVQKAAKKEMGDKLFNLRLNEKNELNLDLSTEDPVATLSSLINIRAADYSESIENMVNRISVVNDKGKVLEVKEDKEDIQKFGIFQDIDREKDSKEDNLKEKELSSVEYTANLDVDGIDSCISGKNIMISEPETGLLGKFFISTDSHTWSGNDYVMSLGINYE